MQNLININKKNGKKVGIFHPCHLLLEDCQKEQASATKQYKKLKQKAKQTRIQFIQDLASQQATRGNETTSNAIFRINRREEI